jgi:hypothetical protein
MSYKYTVALDFDGVLHSYTGWNEGKLNEPMPGALESVERLIQDGCKVVLYTTRKPVDTYMWLAHYGFPQLDIHNEKPKAHVYLDDRAVTFNGFWTDGLLEDLKNFKTYWEIEGSPNFRPETEKLGKLQETP